MKTIKKLFALILVCTTILTLTGCGEKNVEGSLEDIMKSINTHTYEGLADDEKPMLMDIDVLKDASDNIEYYIGTDEIEYEEIYASEPMMSSIAYSVVLVRMKDGADIEAAKTEIKENVNPRKWMCVDVPKDKVIVKSKGDLIILIMVADDTTREKLEEGFDNL